MADFPFLQSTLPAAAVQELPLFTMYAWDFDKNQFRYDADGHLIVLKGNDALICWCMKALQTERFRWLAYSWRYGIELYQFMAKVMGVQERKSELRRHITECLMVNPYIKSIDSIEMTEDERGEKLSVEIKLTTIYGEVTL